MKNFADHIYRYYDPEEVLMLMEEIRVEYLELSLFASMGIYEHDGEMIRNEAHAHIKHHVDFLEIVTRSLRKSMHTNEDKKEEENKE